jgi:hypothetical protein
MKAKSGRSREERNRVSRNEQVRNEIQNFLQAINSYPERFSREPRISFEEHRQNISRAQKRSESQLGVVRQHEEFRWREWLQSP